MTKFTNKAGLDAATLALKQAVYEFRNKRKGYIVIFAPKDIWSGWMLSKSAPTLLT